ncbi:MAG: hypothetical protein ABFR95_09560 [Actinomycetota bacterium]
MRKYVLAFFALTLLLSACRIESNIRIDIAEDGSAGVGVEIGFDEELLDLATQGGGDLDDMIGDLPDFGDGVSEPIQRVEGDMTYFGVQTAVDDLATWDFGGAQEEFFSEFSYIHNDKSATLAAEIASAGLGDLGGEELPIDPSDLTDDFFSAKVFVKMPGTVTESNADEVLPDGTLVWNLGLTGATEILASSSYGASSISWIWFVVGGVLIVGILAAIAAVVTSRKESEKAVAAAAAAHEAEPATDSETPTEELEETEELSAVSDQPEEEPEQPSAED